MRLVYLSPVPWDSFSQRSHELVRYFHEVTLGEVLWIDPYSTRFPRWDDLYRINCDTKSIRHEFIPDWLSVIKPQAIPIEPIPFSGVINSLFWGDIIRAVQAFSKGNVILGIGKPTVLALKLLSLGKFVSSFYDVMDDFPAFYRGLSRVSMSFRERSLVKIVARVLVSSSSLRDRFSRQGLEACLVLNACASSRLPTPLVKHEHTRGKPPVMGYIGTIGRWFDWQLVKLLANAKPDLQVRLIGPVYSQLPESLPVNVNILPPCSHDHAMAAMKEFDIGLIPFKLTELTASVDPIKFYEYRAVGLPIISSAFGEMTMRGSMNGVYLIGEGFNLTETINKALEYQPNLEEIKKFRVENSWLRRFELAQIFNSM